MDVAEDLLWTVSSVENYMSYLLDFAPKKAISYFIFTFRFCGKISVSQNHTNSLY